VLGGGGVWTERRRCIHRRGNEGGNKKIKAQVNMAGGKSGGPLVRTKRSTSKGMNEKVKWHLG